MRNKRGQGLSTNAIILIILGVIVLVILAVGFMIGWDKLAPWIPSNNVDTIVQQCGIACNTGSVYDYCSMERELKDAEGNEVKTSCAVLSILPEFEKYGVEKCNINCNLPCKDIMINGKKADFITTFETGKNCQDFDGKKEDCMAKGCTWTEASSKCTGTYKIPKIGAQEFYDVTGLTSDIENTETTACGIPK